jgi:Zn-dependent protease
VIGSDLTFQLLVVRFLAGLIIATVQGATIAAVAVLLGDQGPRHDGRLTLLPTSHADLLGLGTLLLTGFGWSKAVNIEPEQLRWGRWGLVVAALAGSVALLLLAYLILLLVIPLLILLPYTAGITAAAFVRSTAQLCVWLALFALLPIPPLAGGQFLAALRVRLPSSAGVMGGVLLLVLSILGITRAVLAPAYNIVAPVVLGVDLVR